MARFDTSNIRGPDPNSAMAGWSLLSNAIAGVMARKQQREMAAAQQAADDTRARVQQGAINARFRATQAANKAAAEQRLARENELGAATAASKAFEAEAGGLPDAARAAEMQGRPYGFRAERVYAAPQDAGNALPQRPTTSAEMMPNGVNAPVDSALQSLMAQDQPPAQPGMAPSAPMPVPQEPISVRYSGPGGQPLGDLDLRKALQNRIAQAEAGSSGFTSAVEPFGDPTLEETAGKIASRTIARSRALPPSIALESGRKDLEMAAQLARGKAGIDASDRRAGAAGERAQNVRDEIGDRKKWDRYENQRKLAEKAVTAQVELQTAFKNFTALAPDQKQGYAYALAVKLARAAGDVGALSNQDVGSYLGSQYRSYLQQIESWVQSKGAGEVPQVAINNLENVTNAMINSGSAVLAKTYNRVLDGGIRREPWANPKWQQSAEVGWKTPFSALFNVEDEPGRSPPGGDGMLPGDEIDPPDPEVDPAEAAGLLDDPLGGL